MMRFLHRRGERGAAAVEFALVLPILLLLVLGLIEFSRLYNIQISLSNAAREGARNMAIHDSQSTAKAAAIAAAPSISPSMSGGQISITPAACAANQAVTVTITYSVSLLTGYFGTTLPLTGKGVMLCGG
ncbi:TadE/TadG family type IV pilus assembly protein [Cryobacterium sp. Hz7]|uniref:TadE/TadG family type IV pilus assembly protein n=1 Tax=Cryobacterium sp. Hz7 TaxID=1259166 RepID=UPI001F547AF0|nr:TadE family type IV pilus minor pilin [Cryobacterium sp. Hz7]